MEYSRLALVYEQLEKASKRLEKTRILADFISEIPVKDLPIIVLLLQGRLFPEWDDRKIGVASRLVMKAIQAASGASIEKVEATFKATGDLGLTAKELLSRKSQVTLFSSKLMLDKVYNNLKSLALLEGAGSVDRKTGLIAELLSSAKPLEGQYIVRTILEDLRIGAGQGSLRDALVWAYFRKDAGIDYETYGIKNREIYSDLTRQVQEAFDISLDLGQVASLLKEKGIQGISELGLQPGKPVRSMLFQKAKGIADAFEQVGRPAAFEFKYDGFRLQIHKDGKKVQLFTRKQEDVTEQFPDVINYVKEVKAKSCILDAEAVGYKDGKYMPFQSISQRIRRKHGIEDMARRFPVEVNVFDILYLDGKSIIAEPFTKRREALLNIIKGHAGKLVISKILITKEDDLAGAFYDEALKSGNEGVMAKNLDSVYKPGSRVGFGVKIKPVMDSLDLVIVAAEWGEGKRSKWLTSYTVACQDMEGNLLEIGRVSTGLKELSDEGTSFEDMTKLLESLTAGTGKEVRIKPEIVIEVSFEEVQKSPTYSSGYALRFPRFIRLREDRGVADIDSIQTVEGLYGSQRNR